MEKKQVKEQFFYKLNALKFGVAGGLITAICIFVSTLIGILIPGYGTAYFAFFEAIYGFLGYDVSLLGAILGAIYGFIDGLILTFIFAWIYNRLL